MEPTRDLLPDLQRELAALEADLRERVSSDVRPDLDDELRGEHKAALSSGRTAATYSAWLDEQVTQAAVAWLLGCVFVRFCEDNALVDAVWLAGPDDERRREAADRHAAYFREHPERNDRDWLLAAFSYLAGLPATRALFDRGHNPLWRVTPSGDEAERLVAFWRRTDADGALVHGFGGLDTRFLGDLYQDLSEQARERYALLQTPEFVEELILDRTLTPALRERDFRALKLIDPACGSGHFLLGAFDRLLGMWMEEAPGVDARSRVQGALDSVHGVDVNPFAVAIAEFRLTVAAMRASGDTSLERAPAYDYHLAVGDSLLHGQRQLTLDYGDEADPDVKLSSFAYHAEDLATLRSILQPGRYDVVVGNPPYVTVKDKALNAAYRRRYPTCHRQYALSVPFCERFFQLAKDGREAGWVGQITSNSFMKREFGTKLIESFLARRDLLDVVDTSGAYIPGHGTPTVILVGRDRPPVKQTVRAVLGIRGEPGTPDVPAKGRVWSSIVEHIDEPGTETPYVSVTDLSRDLLARHPWSLSGGGAVELKEAIEKAAAKRLRARLGEIGFGAITGEDDAYLIPEDTARRIAVEAFRPMILGDSLRDYLESPDLVALWPYDAELELRPTGELLNMLRTLWPFRRLLWVRKRFGTPVEDIRGFRWYEFREFYRKRLETPMSIAFAFVATHNHFVLDRGGKVFNRSAPVIKLPDGASEDDHLRLLGLLNSSTACFWLKQVCHDKGSQGVNEGFKSQGWERFYEFTGTKLERFPLPREAPLDLARRLDALAHDLQQTTPEAVCDESVSTRDRLDDARERWHATRREMIALQEELDWRTYRLYGLLDDDLTCGGQAGHADPPGLALGERAFEIVLARKMTAGEEESEWFARHGSTPVRDVPEHWPEPYKRLVRRRVEVIAERPDVALIECPEHKRRWSAEPWDKREAEALRGWLLDRLERRELWFDGQGRPRPLSAAELADAVGRDPEFRDVLAVYAGRPDYALGRELVRLAEPEAVPFLAALRYTDAGLRKREAWEHVWDLQRKEDRGELGDETIPVPPKYAKADFRKGDSWTHRGKLDVPKERFVSYPTAERDGEPTSVMLGWAGWDHLQQAVALATLFVTRTSVDGWRGEQVAPLLAGLVELQPWLEQWHAGHDPAYGTSPAAYFATFVERYRVEHGLSMTDLRAWRPSTKARRRRR